MNRRDFLRPRNLIGPAGQLLGSLDRFSTDDSPGEAASDRAVLLRFGRRAMATTFELIVPFGTSRAQEMAESALASVDRLEAQLTVYRDDSEVSYLNRRAAQEPVAVSENLYHLLRLCRVLHGQTEGAFDVAIGALVKAWGFYRRAGRVPGCEELAALRSRVGMEHVVLDDTGRSVAFRNPGVELNLGSIGKGFALDVVGRELRRKWQCHNALLHGGHSSVLTFGDDPDSRGGWPVGILDPVHPEHRLGVLELRNRALGTSAATYQNLEHEGRKLPHLLDPRTSWPAERILQASVTAPSAADADALATAFFILGVDKTQAFCETHKEIGAVLVDKAGELIVLGACTEEIIS